MPLLRYRVSKTAKPTLYPLAPLPGFFKEMLFLAHLVFSSLNSTFELSKLFKSVLKLRLNPTFLEKLP